MYGMQKALDSVGKLMSVPKEQLEAAFKKQEEEYQKIMEESRIRLIEMYKDMKAKYPESRPVQELCDKELAKLEGTGA